MMSRKLNFLITLTLFIILTIAILILTSSNLGSNSSGNDIELKEFLSKQRWNETLISIDDERNIAELKPTFEILAVMELEKKLEYRGWNTTIGYSKPAGRLFGKAWLLVEVNDRRIAVSVNRSSFATVETGKRFYSPDLTFENADEFSNYIAEYLEFVKRTNLITFADFLQNNNWNRYYAEDPTTWDVVEAALKLKPILENFSWTSGQKVSDVKVCYNKSANRAFLLVNLSWGEVVVVEPVINESYMNLSLYQIGRVYSAEDYGYRCDERIGGTE